MKFKESQGNEKEKETEREKMKRIIICYDHAKGYREKIFKDFGKAREVFKSYKKNKDIFSAELYKNGFCIEEFSKS